MPSIRDIQRKARGDLHRQMSVPAYYIPVPGAQPILVNVRVWRRREPDMLGALPGTQGAAEVGATEDRLRFDLSQVPVLRRLGVVSVEPGEAWRIEYLDTADRGYQTVRVTALSAAEATGLPVPDEDTLPIAVGTGRISFVFPTIDGAGHAMPMAIGTGRILFQFPTIEGAGEVVPVAVGTGRILFQFPTIEGEGAMEGNYTPSLDFSDRRNSMYLANPFVARRVATPRLDFRVPANSQFLAIPFVTRGASAALSLDFRHARNSQFLALIA